MSKYDITVPVTGGVEKSEYEVLAELRYRLRVFSAFSERAAREAGLHPQQHQALLATVGYPGRDRVTIGELAERLQILPHSAASLVNRLARQGLVERIRDHADRRRVFVALTPAGREILERLTAAHRAELLALRPELERLLGRLAP